jgi:hypothetical protein
LILVYVLKKKTIYELYVSTHVRKREWEKKKTRLDVHTCVVGSSNIGVWMYCTFLVCFMSFFFPFYVARAPSLHIHSLPPVVRCYSHFFFLLACVRTFVFSFFFSLVFSLVRVYVRALRLVFFAMRPYGRTRRREKSVIIIVFRVRKRRKKEDGMLT